MRIELYGIARLRAGKDRMEVEATTLGEAIEALGATCPPLKAEHLLFNLNGERFVSDPNAALAESDVLIVLNAHPGG